MMLFINQLLRPMLFNFCVAMAMVSMCLLPLQEAVATKNTAHFAELKTAGFALAAISDVAHVEDAKSLYIMGLKCMTGHEGTPKDYAKARRLFEEATKQGYTKAELMLGTLYYEGLGGDQDYAKARSYFEKAATLNQPSAQFFLGVMEQLGKGTEKNDAKAAQWYEKSARQGHVRANVALGMLYASGKGVKEDLHKAHDYFEFAALRGHNVAQLKLGLMYKLGFGTTLDLPRGYAWLEIAQENGSKKATDYLGDRFTPPLSKADKEKASRVKHELNQRITELKTQKPVL
jgi:uncharacterized protein